MEVIPISSTYKIRIESNEKEITPEKNTVSILNFGDMMFDRNVRKKIEKDGKDPFMYLKEEPKVLNDFDFIIANLEGPIVEMDKKLCQGKAYNFQFASTTPALLKSVGINIVNIANNHIYDCYGRGVESTKKYLKEAEIDYVGDEVVEKSFIIKNIGDKKIVFIGLDRTISSTPISNFYELIKNLKLSNDYIVANIHWGEEYRLVETADQKTVAHGLVDSGADVIFGHHPHVIEPVEVYKDKAVFYSLGNFVFDQIGEERNFGIGAGVEFGENFNKFTVFPYKIKSSAPQFLDDINKGTFCSEYLKNLKPEGCSFKIEVNSEL